MDTLPDVHAPYDRPSAGTPRLVEVYRRRLTPNGPTAWEWHSQNGCSDEWLREHPDWGLDAGYHTPNSDATLLYAPSAHEEGTTVEIRTVVRDVAQGVVVDTSVRVVGAGRPVSIREAAEAAGVAPGTWRAYVARGQAPAADYPAGAHGHVTAVFPGPWWRKSTVAAWVADRPGQGARTDLET
ncbi:hypothetical protein [Streptomyces decoyicus]|uniref:hypothetical protein n=1 Tax=Streptomyces decoyicus TaxID=249567 RepID=UPI00364FE9F1